MDQATIERILARQGAPATPDNINRIIQMSASDPSILERYSMGTAPAQISSGPGRQDIRGGSGNDDNAALLNLAIDKSIQQTQLPPPPAQGDNVQGPAPTPQRRAAPPRPSIPGDNNRPVGAPPFAQPPTAQAYEPSTGAPMPVPSGMAESRAVPPDAASAGGNGMDWLIPSIIATLFGGGGAALMRGGGRVPQVPGAPTVPQVGSGQVPPNRQLPAPNASNHPPTPDVINMPDNSGAPPPPPPRQAGAPMQPGPGQTPADIARMQAEVDAENARGAAQLQQQIKQKAAQDNTRKTLEAGKRVFTGGRK